MTIARKPPAPPATPPTGPSAAAPRKRASPRTTATATISLPAISTPPGTARKKAAAAGPAKARRAKPVVKTDSARLDQLQAVILASLDDDKAENVIALDLQGRASFADRMVVATGIADRQISAMAIHLEQKLAEVGLKRIKIEGASGSDWVLIDAGDIIIHLFKAEARALYGIERMWGADLDETPPEAPPVTEEPEPG